MKKLLVPFLAILFLASCGMESVTDMQPDQEVTSEDLLIEGIGTDKLNENMRLAPAGSCESDCIEQGGSVFFSVSDVATLRVGRNTKSVNYSAYNTETDFVVEVTYAITAGPPNAKATIRIDIAGNIMEYTDVSSGSKVSHTVPLAEGWAGCDEVTFSVVQEGLGAPITFSESYALIPVCSVVAPPLTVEKTAVGTYDRTVNWQLMKTVSQGSHTGAPGDEFLSNWTVTATKSEISANYSVTGTITVTNPNSFAVPFTLADVLNDGTVAVITCPGTGDNTGTVAAGGSVSCAYSAAPKDGSATLNTATVTFDVGSGLTNASATADVTFTENLIGDEAVTLSDPRVAYSELISTTTVEIFTETFTCPTDQSLYTDGVYMETFTNIAYLDGDNTDLEASAEVTINCYLPSSECFSPDFWSQNTKFWTGYDPSDLYADVFGVPRFGTLLENVTANGGGANALARHSVAAILNATRTEVGYDLTVSEIIAGVQAAYASGDFESFKNVLEVENEKECLIR
ncbi:hypothetical protein SAMN00777080_1331 [Aquiflexum balticum DSM 16537]|uniref:Uncharacterized protein n=1 Tax=Aquiflexum balticum DSM 16537 TaxID=758820 RepID=A0A1W2H2P4_9BACT|nr:hypothetical protein [Aquiflexum balticum]SMD42766.1 hypothetical protein SAMN00777080_1331 [Aquiflexum balticum DSM 16537]